MVRAIVTAVRNATYVYRLAAAAFKRDAITKSARRESLQIQLFLQIIRSDIE